MVDEVNAEPVKQHEGDKTAAEVEQGEPKLIVERWLAELEMADAAEKEFRDDADKIFEKYEGDEEEAFNILWSNTETVIPSVYNSTPVPDVRRRFRDPDPIGKAVGKIIERALSYSMDDDTYDFNHEVSITVLDSELLGRGVARIKYTPVFQAIPPAIAAQPQGAAPDPSGMPMPGAPGASPGEGMAPSVSDASAQPQATPEPMQRISDQSVELQHVQWDKFRRGPGKTWNRVPWVEFEHNLTKDDCVKQFGPEIANKLEYTDNEESAQLKTDQAKAFFRTTKVHEIWDKDERRVLFIAPCYLDQPLLVVADPLKLRQFLPMPRPVYSILNSRSLVPRNRYTMYKRKADQLELLSTRIDKVSKALRVRGAYAGNLKELQDIIDGEDGDMIAVNNISAIADGGGLDKLIWIMPIQQLAATLKELYAAAAQVKQEIYEIIGLSDIMRGATDASETLGAQELKSKWGSVRLENYKREVQRFARDVLRLMAEIICKHYTQPVLQQITQVKLPSAQEKQMAAQALQMAKTAAMAPQPSAPPPGAPAPMPQASGPPPVPGAPGAAPMPPPGPPPELLAQAQAMMDQPTWDDVMATLRSDFMRSTRVDIETDSTVAETVNREMEGTMQAVQAIGSIISEAVPAVQSGMVPVEAVKNLAIGVARRARFGQVVEDALEEMQPPAPPPQEAPPVEQGPHPDTEKAMKLEQQLGQEKAAGQHQKQLAELDKRKAELDGRDRDLNARQSQLDNDGAALDARSQDLDTREASLEKGAKEQQSLSDVVMQLAQAQAQQAEAFSANMAEIGKLFAEQQQMLVANQKQLNDVLSQLSGEITRKKTITIKGSNGNIYEASAN